MKRLLLLGGGHAHVEVLRRFARRPEPGIAVTLISRDRHTIYSGMLPSLVAGTYGPEEASIDLPALCARAGAQFLKGEVTRIDRDARTVFAGGELTVGYDILSVDIGSSPDFSVPGAREHALAIRPVPNFLEALGRMTRPDRAGRLLVVGAGIGGAELALPLCARFRGREEVAVTLVARDGLSPGLNGHGRRALRAALDRHRIVLVENADVVTVEAGCAAAADGRRFPFDHLVWATGAGAPAWLRDSGLALDADGFIAVDATLRSTNTADVFAAGDVATVLPHPRPKAGVFAVRQGPPLAANLRRALRGEAPRPFIPQRNALALIGTGDGRAIAAKGPFAAEGRWVWWLKRWIDRRWVARYRL